MNEYQKQAEDFLKATSTILTVTFKKYAKHFIDDKQERNIYKVHLQNKRFGFVFDFGQSINGTKSGEVPTAYDILTCLQKYDVGTFEDFCGVFGYPEHDNTGRQNRATLKLYNAVCEEFENVSRLFTDEEIEQLQEIQ